MPLPDLFGLVSGAGALVQHLGDDVITVISNLARYGASLPDTGYAVNRDHQSAMSRGCHLNDTDGRVGAGFVGTGSELAPSESRALPGMFQI